MRGTEIHDGFGGKALFPGTLWRMGVQVCVCWDFRQSGQIEGTACGAFESVVRKEL